MTNDKWNVIVCANCGETQYVYGDVEENHRCEGCDSERYIVKTEQMCNAEDIAVILENDIEDSNWHEWVWWPKILNRIMSEHRVDDQTRKGIMQEIADYIRKHM